MGTLLSKLVKKIWQFTVKIAKDYFYYNKYLVIIAFFAISSLFYGIRYCILPLLRLRNVKKLTEKYLS
jgi:hypothetical protein